MSSARSIRLSPSPAPSAFLDPPRELYESTFSAPGSTAGDVDGEGAGRDYEGDGERLRRQASTSHIPRLLSVTSATSASVSALRAWGDEGETGLSPGVLSLSPSVRSSPEPKTVPSPAVKDHSSPASEASASSSPSRSSSRLEALKHPSPTPLYSKAGELIPPPSYPLLAPTSDYALSEDPVHYRSLLDPSATINAEQGISATTGPVLEIRYPDDVIHRFQRPGEVPIHLWPHNAAKLGMRRWFPSPVLDSCVLSTTAMWFQGDEQSSSPSGNESAREFMDKVRSATGEKWSDENAVWHAFMYTRPDLVCETAARANKPTILVDWLGPHTKDLQYPNTQVPGHITAASCLHCMSVQTIGSCCGVNGKILFPVGLAHHNLPAMKERERTAKSRLRKEVWPNKLNAKCWYRPQRMAKRSAPDKSSSESEGKSGLSGISSRARSIMVPSKSRSPLPPSRVAPSLLPPNLPSTRGIATPARPLKPIQLPVPRQLQRMADAEAQMSPSSPGRKKIYGLSLPQPHSHSRTHSYSTSTSAYDLASASYSLASSSRPTIPLPAESPHSSASSRHVELLSPMRGLPPRGRERHQEEDEAAQQLRMEAQAEGFAYSPYIPHATEMAHPPQRVTPDRQDGSSPRFKVYEDHHVQERVVHPPIDMASTFDNEFTHAQQGRHRRRHLSTSDTAHQVRHPPADDADDDIRYSAYAGHVDRHSPSPSNYHRSTVPGSDFGSRTVHPAPTRQSHRHGLSRTQSSSLEGENERLRVKLARLQDEVEASRVRLKRREDAIRELRRGRAYDPYRYDTVVPRLTGNQECAERATRYERSIVHAEDAIPRLMPILEHGRSPVPHFERGIDRRVYDDDRGEDRSARFERLGREQRDMLALGPPPAFGGAAPRDDSRIAISGPLRSPQVHPRQDFGLGFEVEHERSGRHARYDEERPGVGERSTRRRRIERNVEIDYRSPLMPSPSMASPSMEAGGHSRYHTNSTMTMSSETTGLPVAMATPPIMAAGAASAEASPQVREIQDRHASVPGYAGRAAETGSRKYWT